MPSTEELEPKVIDPGPDKIIAPGFNNTTVTDKIANVVLKPIQTTPETMVDQPVFSFCRDAGPAGGRLLAVLQGRRSMGHRHPGSVGLCYRQLRLVDRYRPRRNADLGHSAAAQTGLAYFD